VTKSNCSVDCLSDALISGLALGGFIRSFS